MRTGSEQAPSETAPILSLNECISFTPCYSEPMRAAKTPGPPGCLSG